MRTHQGIFYVAALLIIASLACSLGSDDNSAEITMEIDAETGGQITSRDGTLTLEFPPGALSEDTEISIRAIPAEELPSELAGISGTEAAYLLEPEGLTFNAPVAVSWELDLDALTVEGDSGYQAQALFNWSEPGGCEPLQDLAAELLLDDDLAVLRGSLDHFSYILREDGALSVALVEVDYEHLVGDSFFTDLEISLGVRMHGVLLTDIAGTTIATGQVDLAGSGHFEIGSSLGNYNTSEIQQLFFHCKSEPGLGTYGATVHAMVTWEIGPSTADRVLQVTVTSEVSCREFGAEPLHVVDTGISDFLIEMGFNPELVNSIEGSRRSDGREDWLYSIAQLPPGLRQEYLDLLWFEGLITNAEYEQVRQWFNNSIFPCGELVDDRLTVCSSTAGEFPAGDVLIFAAGFDGVIPLQDPQRHYVFSVVLDGDGESSNNYQYMEPYNWDYYQATDQWYELGWNPQLGNWFLTLRLVRGSQPIERHTQARAVIAGDRLVFFIPASEVAVEMPAFRVTSFGHDGSYAPDVSGGDVSGTDPTEPLTPLEIRLD